jgi:hypothetical protein
LMDAPAKLFPRGAVEAQAEVDKNGDYRLYLLIGDAVEEDDRFKIDLQVGVAPSAANQPLIVVSALAALLLLPSGWLIVRRKKQRSAEQDEAA